MVGFLIVLPLASRGDTLVELRGVWQADFNDDASRVVVQLRSGAVSIWDTANRAVVCADVGKGKETDSSPCVLIIKLPSSRFVQTVFKSSVLPTVSRCLRCSM